MSRRSRSLLIAGIASLSALLLPAGREACAQQVGSLSNTGGLSFGKFVAGTGGTVTVSPTGAAGKTGGVFLLKSSITTAAQFSVIKSGNGKPLKTVSFTLPSDTAVRLSSGSNSMAVTNFVSSPAATPGNSYPAGSTSAISVGATLQVGANQPPGNYSGTFTLIANFQ
jgi:hypothetical protein